MNKYDYDAAIFGVYGFVSNYLLSCLLANNKTVIGYGNINASITHKNYKWQFCDLLNIEENKQKRQPVSIKTFIHSAVIKGRFEEGTDNWISQGKVSAPDFGCLFTYLNIDVERIITIGSSEEYGPRKTEEPICEYAPPTPLSSYGYWKTILLENARIWAKQSNRKHIHLRPSIIYGLGQDPGMFLESLIETLLQDKDFPMTYGEQWRNFVNVDFVSKFISLLVDCEQWSFDIVNIGGPVYMRIIDTAMLVHRLVNRGRLLIGAIPYRDFEVWHQNPSLDRMKTIAPELKHTSFNDDILNLIKNKTSKNIATS